MKKMTIIAVSLLITLANAIWSQASPTTFVGIVRSVCNEAYIHRDDTPIPAEMNMKIMIRDVIKTGPDGSLGLIFEDDTIVSVGPASEFIVEEFLFNPADKKLSFVVRIFQGTFSFLSGQINKLAPDSVRLETPDATIGMRGTHVLVQVVGRR